MPLKIFEALQERVVGRVARPPLLEVNSFYQDPHSSFESPDMTAYRIDVTLGARMVGTPEELPYMRRHMIDMISEEVYGEVIADVRSVIHQMYEKGGMRDEIELLHNIVDKMRGR